MCLGTGIDACEGRSGGTSGGTRVGRRRRTALGVPPERAAQMASQVRGFLDERLEARRRAIDDLVRDAEARGEDASRVHWSIVYDCEMAEATNGRVMLLAHAIIPLPPQDLADDKDLHDELWTVIEGLAESGVFLLNTEHLTDRDLYARLYYRILDEPTRLMPPQSEASEFIDCLHPLDVESGGQGRALRDRLLGEHPVPRPECPPGTRGPACPSLPADRDRWLPRPGC
ncbi:MAG: hypothetical protein RI990_1655 [Planctomycetota bacterium]|jgi:hypothetical protein